MCRPWTTYNVLVFASKIITMSCSWTTFILLHVSSIDDIRRVGLCFRNQHYESLMNDIHSTTCVVHRWHATCRSLLENLSLSVFHGQHSLYFLYRPWTTHKVSVFAPRIITMSRPWTTFTLLTVSSIQDMQLVGLCFKNQHIHGRQSLYCLCRP